MSEESTPKTAEKPKGKRGRPAVPKENKVDLKFHLTLMKEEMALFKAATHVNGLLSTAAFIRSAIDQSQNHPIRKNIPKGLMPSNDDPTTYHYPLLLSAAGKEIVEKEDYRHRCEFIRTATLSKALAVTAKDPTLEAALAALKVAKGAR